MPRASEAVDVRLKKLEKAMDRAVAWPEPTASAVPMAKQIIGVSWTVLRDWCNEIPGFDEAGAFERGAQGNKWSFRPVATVWFLVKHFRGEHEAALARASGLREAIGMTGDTAGPAMGIEEMAKMIKLHQAFREEKMQQGLLVPRERAETAIEQMVSHMQQAALNAAREQDPTNQWEPDIAEAFQGAVESIIVASGAAGEACLKAIRGGTA
jgi:hypothetical protein